MDTEGVVGVGVLVDAGRGHVLQLGGTRHVKGGEFGVHGQDQEATVAEDEDPAQGRGASDKGHRRTILKIVFTSKIHL